MTRQLPGDLDDLSTDPFEVARAAAALLTDLTGVVRHDIALVLGSGWGGAADLLGDQVAEIPATDLPGFTTSAVPGHGGTLRSIRIAGSDRHVLVLGVRTAAAAGGRVVVLTNGCGGLDPSWAPGTAVLIRDHLNLTATSPLEGATFVDLTDLYSARLRAVAHEVDPALRECVYAQFRGPHYETPAEVAMAGVMGADLVGMSTALEAIAARHVGLEVLG